jgi:hypothetical protein
MGVWGMHLYAYVYNYMKKKMLLKMSILYMKRELSQQGEFSFLGYIQILYLRD